MTHTHPMTVQIHVPTPEALHELSIFLQAFMHKHHGHAASFKAETAGVQTAAPASHQAHGQPVDTTFVHHTQGIAMPGMGGHVQTAASRPIEHTDVIALQKRLLESQVLTMPGLMKLYGDLNINPVEQLQPHQCELIHKHLSALPGAR
jgi:hypothetical protein